MILKNGDQVMSKKIECNQCKNLNDSEIFELQPPRAAVQKISEDNRR